MLSSADLTNWLARTKARLDKLLLVLAHSDQPMTLVQLKLSASQHGFRIPKGWNLSDMLRKSGGYAALMPNGWQITDDGKQHLKNLGVANLSPAAAQVATDLRKYLQSVTDAQVRAFVEEAIRCYEFSLYRSAVVMSWLGAVYVLQRHTVQNELPAFNAEAQRVDPKWKQAKTTDDLGRMKEKDFLDRLDSISVLGKNAKTELKQCLDLRNGCGHPNSLKLGANTVTRHLEQLLLNVFQKFS